MWVSTCVNFAVCMSIYRMQQTCFACDISEVTASRYCMKDAGCGNWTKCRFVYSWPSASVAQGRYKPWSESGCNDLAHWTAVDFASSSLTDIIVNWTLTAGYCIALVRLGCYINCDLATPPTEAVANKQCFYGGSGRCHGRVDRPYTNANTDHDPAELCYTRQRTSCEAGIPKGYVCSQVD